MLIIKVINQQYRQLTSNHSLVQSVFPVEPQTRKRQISKYIYLITLKLYYVTQNCKQKNHYLEKRHMHYRNILVIGPNIFFIEINKLSHINDNIPLNNIRTHLNKYYHRAIQFHNQIVHPAAQT